MASLRRVCIVGSGNWGSTIAKIVGNNILKNPKYVQQVNMWVFEEMINGKKLTEIINETHENPKYLEGVPLPHNIVANSDPAVCVLDADVLIFVLPHQFLPKICDQIKTHIKKDAVGVSLIKDSNLEEAATYFSDFHMDYTINMNNKGLDVGDEGGIRLLTDLIRERLSIPCAVLMGANLAYEVSKELFCEATIASKNKAVGLELKGLFQTNYFRIVVIEDEVTTELCGALKNIVAVGAGLSEALGYGDNTKAAIIRLGFMEMKKFIYDFFGDRKPCESTFLESCGVADLITTCYGGRNKRIGQALVTTKKSVSELEKELLNGQSAQGPLTAAEVFIMLKARNHETKYPLFVAIHKLCNRELEPKDFIDCLRNHPEHM